MALDVTGTGDVTVSVTVSGSGTFARWQPTPFIRKRESAHSGLRKRPGAVETPAAPRRANEHRDEFLPAR